MFRTERDSRLALVIEDFRVPGNRSICRALLRELSDHLHRTVGAEDALPPVRQEDRYRIAESFETFIFSDDNPFHVSLRWIAVEAAVARLSWSYTTWAALARVITAEGVFLRTGSAQAASEMLHLPEEVFENVDDMLLLTRGVCRNPTLRDGEEDLRQRSGSFDAGGPKGSIGGMLGISRHLDEINHSESSVGGVEASTVGESGRVGNDPAAEGDASSGSRGRT